jgi:penicillin-binding protein 2
MKDGWPEEFIGQVIKEVVMHEVGHTLGLRHNFKGSSWLPLKKISDPEGTDEVPAPVVSFTLPFSQQTLDILREGMRLVVEGEHGTARSQRRNWYTFGGKTGTAQNPHGDNHSWFGAIAPLENPEIAIVAIIENAGHGSEVAAPVVTGVLDFFMSKKTGRMELSVADTTEVN